MAESKDGTFREYVSDPGSRTRPVYAAKVIASGDIELEQVGEESLYDMIQASRDSCDINKLVKRYQNGEVDILSRVQGVFGDFTQMPKTYLDMLNLQLAAQRTFDELPVDVRQKFSGYEQFLATAGSKEFFDKLGVVFEKPEADASGVKEIDQGES